MKWGQLFLYTCGVLTLPLFVSAEVLITEIMYDPVGADTGREWIEVFNTGSSAVNLTELKLFENGTNHKISAQAGNSMLAPQGYAVIADNPAKFAIDYPGFTEQVFDSAFALSNEGETIILRDGKMVDMSSATYVAVPAASGVGNSLQRAAQSPLDFAPHTPTPGAAMSSSVITPKPKEVPPPKAAKSKTSKKSASSASGSDISDDIVADPGEESNPVSASVASAALPAGVMDSGSSSLWWMGTIALAGVASVATFASRHVAKREWDITEEEEGK
ncbi:lamin tail domain-containing protein [Candidatus Kaiserbacteria bacterium]|nr:lamin tail domain-containing protein [Candidatus Kaiserbacteria bacterium]